MELSGGNVGLLTEDVVSSPAIGADGTIYVGSPDHKLYAIIRMAPKSGPLQRGMYQKARLPSAPTGPSTWDHTIAISTPSIQMAPKSGFCRK